MKTTKRYIVKPDKINSLQDLNMEKERLRLEIMKTEVSIQAGYRKILQAFTFKNLATTMINDISVSSSMLTKAITIGKSFMARRKKKKHDELKEVADNSGS